MLFLTGCAVGPNYKTPKNNVGENWSAPKESPHISVHDPINSWWEQFDDPLLTTYIQKASAYNKDLLTAQSTILQARALRKIAASSFYPHLSSDINATETYFSKNGPVFAIGDAAGDSSDTSSSSTGLPFSVHAPQTQELYNILFDATWEIDVFGKTRRRVEAANAVIGQTIAQRDDTLITIIAEVARNYIDLRSEQQLSALIEENIALLEKKSSLITQQLRFGYTSRLDYENSLALVANEKAKLPEITAKIYRAAYAISVLTGESPEALLEELLIPKPLPKVPDSIAVGIKSDLLRRRPDIREAERALAAATANIGVAVADFFPSLSLTGQGGLQSISIENLFSGGSATWAFGGGLILPIFQGGKIIGNVQAKKAEAAAAGYRYQQVVLKALEEAEGSLITYVNDLKMVKENTIMSNKYEELVVLHCAQYEKGLVGLVNLIDAERQFNESQQSVLESFATSLINIITLYKVLGGGWETKPKPLANNPPSSEIASTTIL